jgi:hypothetical protein
MSDIWKNGTGGSLKFKYSHNTGTNPPGAGSARTEEQTGGPPYKPT